MAPRPRSVTDQDILTATYRAMARLGPVRFTLAEVAREAGLSAATLVQRFGSKRGLLLAASASVVDGVEACFGTYRAQNRSPLAVLIASATEMTRQTQSPEEMANHLAFLHIDVSDPDFRRHMLEMSRRIEAGYRTILDEAAAAGEIVPCDTARLARAIGAIVGGSIVGWAVFQTGTAEAWVMDDLEMLIGPYRAAGPRRTAPRGRRRGLPGVRER